MDFIKENLQVQPTQVQPLQIQDQSTQIPTPQDQKLDKFAPLIEYTVIRNGTTKDDIKKAVEEAQQHKFYGICVPPDLVDYTVYAIDDNTKLKVISYVDFPNGTNKGNDNLTETLKLISDNVDEIDVVMDYKLFKSGYIEDDSELKQSIYDQVESKLRLVVNECHKNGIIIKVIIEIGVLSFEEITKVCAIISSVGADFVMTSTGTVGNGSELEKIKDMRRILPDHIKIKAAGGIRTIQDCDKLYQYVDRIGISVIPK